MKRLKLRNLLNLTEQAPQPPAMSPAAPVPAPVAPPQGMSAGTPDQQPTPEPPSPETSPEPEDPSEYDFTRDFRAFEDKKNKAEAEAKKVLLDKMNKRLLNKTIVANSSRGYGQPKTDYTIENVKKISVEFWYKDYVVIATDANDKKYFLTPGINIKIESEGSQAAPGKEEQPAAPEEVPPQEQPVEQPPTGGEESPNTASPSAPAGDEEKPSAEEQPPKAVPQVNTQEPAPMAPQKVPKTAPAPAEPSSVEPEPEDPRKKKKKVPPVAEWVQKDLNTFLVEFMSDNVKDERGKVNFVPYIKETFKVLAEGVNATKVKCHLLIPESHMINHVDNREVKLAAVDSMRQQTYYGHYSKGSVDIVKNGRYYLLEYVKEVGWNV
jgi:hypothetical protein